MEKIVNGHKLDEIGVEQVGDIFVKFNSNKCPTKEKIDLVTDSTYNKQIFKTPDDYTYNRLVPINKVDVIWTKPGPQNPNNFICVADGSTQGVLADNFQIITTMTQGSAIYDLKSKPNEIGYDIYDSQGNKIDWFIPYDLQQTDSLRIEANLSNTDSALWDAFIGKLGIIDSVGQMEYIYNFTHDTNDNKIWYIEFTPQQLNNEVKFKLQYPTGEMYLMNAFA